MDRRFHSILSHIHQVMDDMRDQFFSQTSLLWMLFLAVTVVGGLWVGKRTICSNSSDTAEISTAQQTQSPDKETPPNDLSPTSLSAPDWLPPLSDHTRTILEASDKPLRPLRELADIPIADQDEIPQLVSLESDANRANQDSLGQENLVELDLMSIKPLDRIWLNVADRFQLSNSSEPQKLWELNSSTKSPVKLQETPKSNPIVELPDERPDEGSMDSPTLEQAQIVPTEPIAPPQSLEPPEPIYPVPPNEPYQVTPTKPMDTDTDVPKMDEPNLLESVPESVRTRSRSLESVPESVRTRSRSLESVPESVRTRSRSLESVPESVRTRSRGLESVPESVRTRSRSLESVPESVRTRSRSLESVPESVRTRSRSLESVPESVRTRSRSLELTASEADVHSRRGFELAGRKAYFTARAEFIRALRLISQALDAEMQTDGHRRALANGLTALKESEDFLPHGRKLEANLDMSGIVQDHQTPILKESEIGTLIPLAAMGTYLTYAQEQLATSVDSEVAGSMALLGLGKIHAAMAREKTMTLRVDRPKAMAIFQAALLADSRNYMASNELGVLLGRSGRFEEARLALEHSLSIQHQEATGWHNLAVVYQKLRKTDLAQRAKHLAMMTRHEEKLRLGRLANTLTDQVRWVPPDMFARSRSQTYPSVRRNTIEPMPTAQNPNPTPWQQR